MQHRGSRDNRTIMDNVRETGTLRGYEIAITVKGDGRALTYSGRELLEFLERCVLDALPRFTVFETIKADTAKAIASESAREVFNELEVQLAAIQLLDSEQSPGPGRRGEHE
jgi:hypothetical protein